ncbi:unnamed protein product [Meloidogyne enterolobii]|uniref:Uncharacterized protein n=1 Tax=Meloidogyne enterolobii TaxID=390850 RepID=A0ACB0Z6M5_MELEN
MIALTILLIFLKLWLKVKTGLTKRKISLRSAVLRSRRSNASIRIGFLLLLRRLRSLAYVIWIRKSTWFLLSLLLDNFIS